MLTQGRALQQGEGFLSLPMYPSNKSLFPIKIGRGFDPLARILNAGHIVKLTAQQNTVPARFEALIGTPAFGVVEFDWD
jgi:hypothetical protein